MNLHCTTAYLGCLVSALYLNISQDLQDQCEQCGTNAQQINYKSAVNVYSSKCFSSNCNCAACCWRWEQVWFMPFCFQHCTVWAQTVANEWQGWYQYPRPSRSSIFFSFIFPGKFRKSITLLSQADSPPFRSGYFHTSPPSFFVGFNEKIYIFIYLWLIILSIPACRLGFILVCHELWMWSTNWPAQPKCN